MTLSQFLQSKWPSVFSALLLPGAYALFAYAHWVAYQDTQRVAMLLMAACEAVVAVLFLVRTEPESVSGHPGDWVLAIGTALLPNLFRPVDAGLADAGDVLVATGAGLLFLSLLSLNRSLAVVPALRRIRTGGMYRLVRHPLYLSYHVLYPGYVLANFNAANVAVCIATLVGLWARAIREEAHLSAHADYRAYAREVRHRIIPFVL